MYPLIPISIAVLLWAAGVHADPYPTSNTGLGRVTQSQSGLANRQETYLGGSRSWGTTDRIGGAKVRVERLEQRSSGLLSHQEADIGTMRDSTISAKADIAVAAGRLVQIQSGLLNEQRISLGTAR